MISKRERNRLEILSRVKQGVIAVSEAAELMSVSERQGWRIWARYQASGDRGLVHGLRGQRSNHRATAGHQRRVIARYRKYYLGWNEAHAAERRTAYYQSFVIGEFNTNKQRPLHEAIKKKPRDLGINGGTVLRGTMGVCAYCVIDNAIVLIMCSGLPIVIEIVDAREEIVKLLAYVDDKGKCGMITMEEVRIILYCNNPT